VRKSVSTLLLALGCVALLAGTAAATFQSVCRLSSGSSYLDAGPSYCHNAATIFYHELYDCPCRAKGHVSATGPFACTFYSRVEWGGGFGGGIQEDEGPVAMVTHYDIPLDCGEGYKVELKCACEGRPQAIIYYDHGDCSGDCEGDPPLED
jgi:hypothetical protein